MKRYTIREGFSFVMPDNSVKVGGDTVDLPDDVAEQHFHKFEALPEQEPAVPEKAAGKSTAPAGGDSAPANPE